MNHKKNRSRAWLWCLLILAVVVPLIVLLVMRMEGTSPTMVLDLKSPSLGASQKLSIMVADEQTGIRAVHISLFKDGKEIVLLDRKLPSGSILAGGAHQQQHIVLDVEPKALGLTDGKGLLRLVARDYAWRNWGKGNHIYEEHSVLIDTRAPEIDVISPALYLSQGGSGAVIYTLSEACQTSGVSVGDDFYPGYGGFFSDPLTHLAMIALDYKKGKDTRLMVKATDEAGNVGQVGLSGHIRAKNFRKDNIRLGDNFINRKMPEFASSVQTAPGAPLIETFLKVNRDLRLRNFQQIVSITSKSDPQKHWEGAFIRLPGAANRAGFADHRNYLYHGKTIDKQTHLGMDLASLQHSPVPAANKGKVVYADSLGIYGRTVIIDHGFGLFSLYAHLSKIDVSAGSMVSKGDTIGKTGKTGLAGGDHLHYSMLVHHTFVNPIEWWDAGWIQDNIVGKIGAVQ